MPARGRLPSGKTASPLHTQTHTSHKKQNALLTGTNGKEDESDAGQGQVALGEDGGPPGGREALVQEPPQQVGAVEGDIHPVQWLCVIVCVCVCRGIGAMCETLCFC